MSKLFTILLTCTGAWAMQLAPQSSAVHAQLQIPGTRIITLDINNESRELILSERQLTRLTFLHSMLEEAAPESRSITDLRESCAHTPHLRYETLNLVADLVAFDNPELLQQYLDSLHPTQTIALVPALDFLGSSATFAMTHTYLIEKLIHSRAFFEASLANMDNLSIATRLGIDNHVSASINLLKMMRLKNNLVVVNTFSGWPMAMSPDGSLLIVGKPSLLERITHRHGGPLASNSAVDLYRTSNGRRLTAAIQNANQAQFTSDGSLLATEQIESSPAGLTAQTLLYHTHNFSQVGPAISGWFHGFGLEDETIMVLVGGENNIVLLYNTHDLSRPLATTNRGHRVAIGSKVIIPGMRAGGNFRVSANGQFAAVRETDSSIKLYRRLNADRSELAQQFIGATHGSDCALSPDGSLIAIEDERTHHIAVFGTQGLPKNQVPVSILDGIAPLFSPDGKRLVVQSLERQQISEEVEIIAANVKIYNTSNWTQAGGTIAGNVLWVNDNVIGGWERNIFSPDGLLLLVGKARRLGELQALGSLYFSHDASPLLEGLHEVELASNDTDIMIAYATAENPFQTTFKRTLAMKPHEYLLVLAAIHQGSDFDESFWRTMFEQAQPRVQEFVRKKTGKFTLPFWQRLAEKLAATLHG